MSKNKKTAASLEAYADEKTAAIHQENAEIARSARALRIANRQLEDELQEVKRKLGIYEGLSTERLEPPKWLTPTKRAKDHVGIPALMFADPHYGAVVKPEQVDMVNAYNPAIAEQRIKKLFDRAVILTRDFLSGVRYEGIQLFLAGDNFSGDIHEELRETNALTIAESVAGLLEPLEAGINLLTEVFERVSIDAVVGNHGRTTRKPRSKNRAQDNYDGLLYRLLYRDYRNNKKVTVRVSDAADAQVQIYNTRYLLTHGDQFHGGSGISGALAPLLLGAHRKTRRAAAAQRPYDVMVMGHFHQTIMFPAKGLIVGGTVMGFDEYAYTQNMEPEPPQQAFWITTPEHGVTFPMPIYVMDREAEGW